MSTRRYHIRACSALRAALEYCSTAHTAWNIPSTRPESSSRHNGFSSKSVAVCALAAASALCEDCRETDVCALLHAKRQIGAEPSGVAHQWSHHGTMAGTVQPCSGMHDSNHAPSIPHRMHRNNMRHARYGALAWLGPRHLNFLERVRSQHNTTRPRPNDPL